VRCLSVATSVVYRCKCRNTCRSSSSILRASIRNTTITSSGKADTQHHNALIITLTAANTLHGSFVSSIYYRWHLENLQDPFIIEFTVNSTNRLCSFYARDYLSNKRLQEFSKKIHFDTITQNNDHYTVQSHSNHRFWYQLKAHMRLPICQLILTYIPSLTVSKLLQITGQICSFDIGVALLNTLVLGEPLNSRPRNLALRNRKHRSTVWCKSVLMSQTV